MTAGPRAGVPSTYVRSPARHDGQRSGGESAVTTLSPAAHAFATACEQKPAGRYRKHTYIYIYTI